MVARLSCHRHKHCLMLTTRMSPDAHTQWSTDLVLLKSFHVGLHASNKAGRDQVRVLALIVDLHDHPANTQITSISHQRGRDSTQWPGKTPGLGHHHSYPDERSNAL